MSTNLTNQLQPIFDCFPMENYSKNALTALLRQRTSENWHSTAVTHNHYVIFNDYNEDVTALATQLQKILHETIPSMYSAMIPEQILLENPERLQNERFNRDCILYILRPKDAPMDEADLAHWEQVQQIASSPDACTLILVTTSEIYEKRFRPHDNLHYRFFTRETQIRLKEDFTPAEIHERLNLEMDNLLPFRRTEAFDARMSQYLEAVYKTADLKRMDFINDMLRRVNSLYYMSDIEDDFLTEACVPYWNENKGGEDTENSEDPNESEEIGEPEAISDSINSSAPEEKGPARDAIEGKTLGDTNIPQQLSFTEKFGWEAHEKTVSSESDSKGDAGIFVVLSRFNPKSSLADYKVANNVHNTQEKWYKGIQTNDAPIQYLIDEVFSSGYKLKKVVCINTEEVEQPIKDGDISAYERFTKLVKEYVDVVWGTNDVEVENIKYIPKENEDKTYYNFYKQLNDRANNLNACFVDYTGGLRDMSFLMVAAIRFLEFKGIKCIKVIYSDFYAKPDKQLKTLDEAYNIFQMINGMSEFVSSGTTRQLDVVFNQENSLIRSIRAFSHATNVGDILNLDKYIKELNSALSQSNNEEESLNEVMISSMNEIIRDKIFGQDKKDKLISKSNEINYYRLIDWCIENKMYQQACTLYIEKVPLVYWREHIISDLVPLAENTPMGSSCEVTTFYTDLPRWLISDSRMSLLQSKLNQIDLPTLNDWDLSRFCTNLRNLFKDYSEPEVCRRLTEICQTGFRNYFKGKKVSPCKGLKINQGDIYAFIRNLKYQTALPIHYYLLDGTIDNAPPLKDKPRTAWIINRVYDCSEAKTNDDRALCILLAFYLGIKLLRNKMSHASETQDEDDIAAAKSLEAFFQRVMPEANIVISLEEGNVHTLLAKAMEYTKMAEPFRKAPADC